MSDNPKFDFETLFKQFDPSQMAKQFQEMFANSPFGDMNTTDLMETQRKTLESIKQANETAVSGAQSLMERQSEMMQQAMADAAKAMQNLAESEPTEAASDNAALVEDAVKKSMENFGEIADMIQGIYTEISDQVERRMEESVNEMKESLAKTKK